MNGKRAKQLRRDAARRQRAGLNVRCDDCGLVQPITMSHTSRPTPCTGCGCLYGTYA